MARLGTPGWFIVESETHGVGFEGRHVTAGPVSVAWCSEVGPRDENQDRARCRLRADGSWLVAVADGLGGHPRGRAAARSAIRTLPRRIEGPDEMYAAFRAAHKSVVKLASDSLRFTIRDIHMCPASTLSVAAWTPENGLVVGIAGDTRVAVMWRDEQGWHGRPVGRVHRSAGRGYLTRFLGTPRVWPKSPDSDRVPMDMFGDDDIEVPGSLSAFTVVIASDGAWEALEIHTKRPIADAIASVLDIDHSDAHSITTKVMDTARETGLADNATLAVACIVGEPDADAA